MQKVIDIEPIWADYITILNEKDLEDVVELPLLNPCKELYRKNIITIMSSCNKFNVLGLNNYANNKMIGKHMEKVYSLGNNNAWLMIDYDSLSEENKQIISDYYYQNPKRFIYTVESQDDYNNAPLDFKEKCNGTIDLPHYNKRAIIMKYELSKETTTKEVNDYFLNIACSLKSQSEKLNEKEETRFKLLELAKKYKKPLEQMEIYIDNSMFKNLYLNNPKNDAEKLYGLKDETAILWTLFIIATLDIFGLLEEESALMILSIKRNDICFIYNGKEYHIASFRNYPKEQLLRFGNTNRGIEKIKEEKELLDLFRKLDASDILLSQQYLINEEIKRNI